MKSRSVIAAALALGSVLLPARCVWADSWGCQVLLCLADPRGPEKEAQCVPPIEKLWTALRHGNPFPSCDFSSSANDLPQQVLAAIPEGVIDNFGRGTGASNTWASGGYCAPGMLYWGGAEKSELMCRATGAINVTVDGSLFTRVWWGMGGGSITEYYGNGSTAVPYDPSTTQQQFLNRQDSTQSGSAGNH